MPFYWVARGVLKILIGGTYPLAEAFRAHADMESRTTSGKLLLIPYVWRSTLRQPA
jgi:NADPH2:quinone reductase